MKEFARPRLPDRGNLSILRGGAKGALFLVNDPGPTPRPSRGRSSSPDEVGRAAKAASRKVALASSADKRQGLLAMARALLRGRNAILAANAADVRKAERSKKSAAFLDRLALDSARVAAMAEAVEEVARLPDPVGERVDAWRRPNGLRVEKRRLPLGVVLMVYEARPNVTSDAAALCLQAGNAVILRGGKEAAASNRAIVVLLRRALERTRLPPGALTFVEPGSHESLKALLRLEGLVDLCIPRGGEGLIRFVAEHARVPVVKHYKGVCHVYVHASADLEMAARIVVNAKTSRPGVCNAAECLLVDREVAERFLPEAGRLLAARGVELRACPASFSVFRRAGVPAKKAHPDDFGREFLDLVLAVRVVRGLDQALEHISRFGSEHTEALVARDVGVRQRFAREVSASAVMVNTSTRFNDGGSLGLGAEIGISTSRLHAFGPMGLRELTSSKYVVLGNGQVR